MPDQTSTVTGVAEASTGASSAASPSTASSSTGASSAADKSDLFIGAITYDVTSDTSARRTAGTSVVPRVSYRAHRLGADERGAATAEYAIATMAAVGFAGLLVVIMRSDEIRGILTDLVRNALTFVG